MKKILLSCVTCLLAVGLLAGCNNEEEDVTPNEPETTVPSGDTSEDDEGSSLPVTCKLGALDEENYTYRWFTGAASGNFLATSISWEKGIDVTISDAGSSDDGVTLSFVDETNATKYISWSSGTSVDITDEPYSWYWVEENSVFAAGSTEGRALVLYTNGSVRAYAQNDTNLAYPHVMAFSEKPTYPVAPELPDTVAWEDGGTYLFGVNTIGAVRYIDGGVVDSSHTYEGSLTTNLTYAVLVTIAAVAETNAYTLTFEVEGVTYYITTTTSGDYVNLAYSTEEAYLYWNETYGCWGNEEATHFLCYNSSYSCLYCSAIEDYYDGETPVASTYATVELPAPTELEISGPETVYLGHSAKYSVVVNEGADASVTWTVASEKGATIDVYGNLTAGSEVEEVTITATSTATDATVTPATITVSIEEEPTIIKLGALDSDYYTYRWFNGSTTGSTFLASSMNWDDGADVYVAAISKDNIEGSCTLSFVNASGELKYIKWSNSTSITVSDEPYTWVWDSSNEVFHTNETPVRYLRLLPNSTSFRAYISTTEYDAYPAVKPYKEEPTAPTVPEDYPTLTAADSLVSGSTYYIGCQAYNGASYIFDGGNYSDQQLTASVQPTSFVAVTATGNDTDGWTFTFKLLEGEEGQNAEVEYTLYSYMSNDYCEISAVASSSLEETLSAEDLVASSTFGWDSTHYGITVTLGETTYFLAQNRNSSYPDEFQMASFETYADSDTWISFYPVTIEA